MAGPDHKVVVTGCPRVSDEIRDSYADFGVATVHEAQGRIGQFNSYMRPIYPGAHIVGTAVTVSMAPCDNWMLHVAVEQCRPGDIVVAAPTSPSDAGYFGDLLANSLMARGVRGLIIEAGVRDVKDLTAMGFPVWSRHVNATGTVKGTVGAVNIPLVIAGQIVHPGDLIVADDDGVVVVARKDAAAVSAKSAEREAKEAVKRGQLRAGELGLDIYSMRETLAAQGLVYRAYEGD